MMASDLWEGPTGFYGGRWRPVVAPDLWGRPLGCGGLGMVSEESAENAREYRATVFGRPDN